MKKHMIRTVTVTALLLVALILLTSCETSMLGTSPTFVLRVSPPTQNDRYMLWQGHLETVLVDKESGAVYPMDAHEASLNGLRGRYDYTQEYVFTETAIEWHTHIAIPKYDPDTGAVSHHLYYPAVIFFDYTGTETHREVSETALSEEEARALDASRPASDPTYFSYAREEGSGRDRYEEEVIPPTYTEAQQKAVDYALSLEKQLRGEYHLTWGEGFERDGKIYFSINRSNQKGWASQSATVQGIYHAGIYCYDPATEALEPLLSVGGSREILLFDTTHALVRKGNTIISIPYDGGDAREVFSRLEDESYQFECADGILLLYRFATIEGTPPDAKGYSRFSYPCTLYVFVTPDGRIIARDYDLPADAKEDVTEGSNITYQGW